VEPNFWHERWARDEIGFHQPNVNLHLKTHWKRLKLEPGAHVFVPLCGKSLDLLWLRDQGFRVSGIEISGRAIRDFFAENQLSPEVRRRGDATRYRNGDLEIWEADFFESNDWRIDTLDAIYDRAALVALPPEMRSAYASRIGDLTPPGVRALLLTLDYPSDEMNGPPFAVPADEVKQLFDARFDLAPIHSEDCLAREPRFRAKGLTRMEEHVFLMQRN
jgi:thiopurine S-methyltransferase